MTYPVLWFTGLPCSGKTTLAKEIARNTGAELLDGDEIRSFMRNTDFSPEGREKHMLCVAEWAHRFSKHVPVVVALVSPIEEVRNTIMNSYPYFVEVFTECSIEECKRRDVKGMYKKAMAGEIKGFTGVDAEYEEPTNDFTEVVNTEVMTIKECTIQLLDKFFPKEVKTLFIGRYQPWHDGHQALVNTVEHEGKIPVIGLRNTRIDEKNPYSIAERKKMIQDKLGNIEVITVPDIAEVAYGRGVGYNIREIKLDKVTEAISATDIRRNIEDGKKNR